jgi:hypothetical protein
MKITVSIDTYHPQAAIGLSWKMPVAEANNPSSLYVLPAELTPTQHPHAVKDMSHVAVFYDEHFTLFHAPSNSFSCEHRNKHAVATAKAEVIYLDSWKFLDVIRKLHAKSTVAETVLDTDRFSCLNRPTPAVLTVTQLAAHPNLRNRDLLGKTLKHFQSVLTAPLKESRDRCRNMQQLMWDLSHYVRRATLAAMGDEFYFDGRRPGQCGFNGGIIPHTYDNSYGIHT